jgi:hypothetical protein
LTLLHAAGPDGLVVGEIGRPDEVEAVDVVAAQGERLGASTEGQIDVATHREPVAATAAERRSPRPLATGPPSDRDLARDRSSPWIIRRIVVFPHPEGPTLNVSPLRRERHVAQRRTAAVDDELLGASLMSTTVTVAGAR